MMNFIAGIRLVIAATLTVVISATMAFAHTGHEHAVAAPVASHAAQQKILSSVSIDLSARTSAQFQAGLEQPQRPVVAATNRTPPASDCASGVCCCCNGYSNCGMAGACHALALPAADDQHVLIRERTLVPIAASEPVSGSILFGLDRPPKA